MGAAEHQLEQLLLQYEVENFLAREAELLDERKYNDWLALLDDDLRYWMPLTRNFKYGNAQDEYTKERAETAWFDEDKKTLSQRVKQIQGGDHWVEEPASRTTHLVASVRVDSVDGDEVGVKSRFMVYANRGERETSFFVGKRNDVLRRTDSGFRLLRRAIYLDQHIVTAKSLAIFF